MKRLLLAIVLCLGCSAHQMYPGPRLDSAQIAVLSTVPQPETIVSIKTIDGQELCPIHWSAEFLPGKHYVIANIKMRTQEGWYVVDRRIIFEAEAGHTYMLIGYYLNGMHLWVTDDEAPE